jgi:2'-hydroxyisoflavone reductase
MAQEAIDRGHQVTLFHRGQSGADLFPEAEHILGDRNTDLGLIEGSWDVVVDVAGYKPSEVRRSTAHLKALAARYAFVSTISVHTDEGDERLKEDSPLQVMPEGWDGADETVTPTTYGALKALCEGVVREEFSDKALIFRPGLVVGPNDVTDRFTYWVRAAATQESVQIPTTPDQPVQFTDARDLGALMIHLIESGWNGTVNATGPVHALTFGAMWEQVQKGTNARPQTEWDTDGPAPLPCAKGFDRFMTFDNSRAVQLGLKPRPVADTARDVWAWDQARGLPDLSTEPSRFKKSES